MSSRQLDEQGIFNTARQIDSPQSRADYLQEACGEDEAMRRRVDVLLDAYDRQSRFLELRSRLATFSAMCMRYI